MILTVYRLTVDGSALPTCRPGQQTFQITKLVVLMLLSTLHRWGRSLTAGEAHLQRSSTSATAKYFENGRQWLSDSNRATRRKQKSMKLYSGCWHFRIPILNDRTDCFYYSIFLIVELLYYIYYSFYNVSEQGLHYLHSCALAFCPCINCVSFHWKLGFWKTPQSIIQYGNI